ncbi:2Fe-2S iron-sulfur cluster binding domain-containing protein [Pseudomonas wenzhouensis]|nr:2Fe-2S iron-sulfur cluster binding domain-containing protein [Pseudomonas wenzhouensis]MDM9653249.1 2Fe-2S iron-sulfur cluster binding domain-containing protein [Pseudomonas wenzhouensis]
MAVEHAPWESPEGSSLSSVYLVRIKDTGDEYVCSSEQHLLRTMAALGRRGIPSGCHGGGCGVCKVRILEGYVQTLAMSRAHVSEEEQRQGCVLACRAYPHSDLVVEVIGGMRKAMSRHPNRYGFI